MGQSLTSYHIDWCNQFETSRKSLEFLEDNQCAVEFTNTGKVGMFISDKVVSISGMYYQDYDLLPAYLCHAAAHIKHLMDMYETCKIPLGWVRRAPLEALEFSVACTVLKAASCFQAEKEAMLEVASKYPDVLSLLNQDKKNLLSMDIVDYLNYGSSVGEAPFYIYTRKEGFKRIEQIQNLPYSDDVCLAG